MRPQYHLRQSPRGLLAWDVQRLVRLAEDIESREVLLSSIGEIDENYWFNGQEPTCRAVVAHMQLVNDCDLSHPILLDAEARVMDGMHRVAKALLLGRTHILAKRFKLMPEPDYIGRHADDLTYESHP